MLSPHLRFFDWGKNFNGSFFAPLLHRNRLPMSPPRPSWGLGNIAILHSGGRWGPDRQGKREIRAVFLD